MFFRYRYGDHIVRQKIINSLLPLTSSTPWRMSKKRTYSGIARVQDTGKRFGRPLVLNEEQKQREKSLGDYLIARSHYGGCTNSYLVQWLAMQLRVITWAGHCSESNPMKKKTLLHTS